METGENGSNFEVDLLPYHDGIRQVSVWLHQVLAGFLDVFFVQGRKVGSENLDFRIDLSCDVNHIERDGFSFSVAVQPKNEDLAPGCIGADVLGNLCLLLRDVLLQRCLEQRAVRSLRP